MPPITEPPEPENDREEHSNLNQGGYSRETWSDDFCSDATDADEEARARFLGDSSDDGDIDTSSGGFAELDEELDNFLEDAQRDPTEPRRARGAPLWVGFDSEWVFDEATQRNHILSIQLFVPAQEALSCVEKKQPLARKLSRVVYATGPEPENRPSLQKSLRHIVDEALAARLIEEEPKTINVVGFGLRFDVASLSDFSELKSQLDSAGGRISTVGAHARMAFARSLRTGEMLDEVVVGLRFIDVAAHVPPGWSLRAVGALINLHKLDIPPPYSIERMGEYLQEDRVGFEAYAMRDAEIAVMYALRLAAFAYTELGIKALPATASGLALKWCLSKMEEAGIDRLSAFGLHKTQTEAWHTPSKQARTIREVQPTPMRRIQEAFITDCYAGGRNEAFYIGPTPVGHWFDYDLAGAYSTGLVDLPLIDFEKPRSSLITEDYLGHVAGYALIKFKHAAGTRFPVFAVSRGGKGLIFPMEGTAYATAPEIRAAVDLGCSVEIRWGIIYSWQTGELAADGIPVQRLFAPFIKAARALRNKYKSERLNRDPEDQNPSLEEEAAKLYANSVYGKVCQSLRPKNVFDTRSVSTIQLKPSPITNPAIGAHVTGFIRAILAEILNKIPRERSVISVTTDGFLTDATEDELDLTGPLCMRFKQLCEEVVPGSKMLEIKHEVAQIVCMRTRGQLTGAALPKKSIVLAKAGVQPVVTAPADCTKGEYKALQNTKMLNLYMDRRPGKKILLKQFPSIRDQWEKGVDLYKFTRHVKLSLEPDLKRAPLNPRMIEVVEQRRMHLALDTRPWRTVEEFDSARARMDGWRRHNCLKTIANWDDLNEALQFSLVRLKQRSEDLPILNIRKGRPASDVLRRAFLRAYSQQAIGLTRSLSYPELAQWLTTEGYETFPREVTSSRSQKLVLRGVPRTPDVLMLWQRLQQKFPDADLEQLLAEE